MTSLALEFGEFDLPQRNVLASRVIEKYATGHAIADSAIGIAGFAPIPFAGPASILAALVAQIPIYKSLAEELARIYESPHDDIVRGIVNTGMAIDSAAVLTAELASEFGMAFVQEIGAELARELGLDLFLSCIPVLGGFVSLAVDVTIAVTMTWRVGTMVSLYYQNGRNWIESRRKTYEIAKELTGGLSKTNHERVDLNAMPWRVKQVWESQIRDVMRFVRNVLVFRSDAPDDMILDFLKEKGVGAELAQEALRRVRDGGGDVTPEMN